MSRIGVRELSDRDIEGLVSYWNDADAAYLIGMGVDLSKLPAPEVLKEMLEKQLLRPYAEKQAYALIWLYDAAPIGHCNVNNIEFGKQAFMHLHIWKPQNRARGIGQELVKLSVPFFFENLKLKQLFCEPYALNEAPNRTLAKCGFQFVKKHTTVPGSINFEQPVNRWVLTEGSYRAQITV